MSFSYSFHNYFFGWSFILAHMSLSVTVRLNTGLPGAESRVSTQKYPSLSNWQENPGAASARLGSTLHPSSIRTE
jgi:hypothetical protein